MLLGDRDHLLQRGDVAEHRIDAFEHHQLAGFLGQAAEALVEVGDVVVAEADDLGIALLAAVVDRGVAVGVEDDVFALAGERRDDAQIGHVPGREHDRAGHVVELAQGLLDVDMVVERAVEHPAAIGARPERVERVFAGLDDVGVERHPHVIIGAEQDRVLAADHRLGRRLHLVHHDREGVAHAGPDQRLAFGDEAVELRHQVAFGGDLGDVEGEGVGGGGGFGHVRFQEVGMC